MVLSHGSYKYRISYYDFCYALMKKTSPHCVPNLYQGSGQRVGHRGHMRMHTKRSA